MKKISLFSTVLLSVLLLGFTLYNSNSGDLKPGLYEYFYISTYMTFDKVTDGNWKKPLKLDHSDHVAYRVINNDLIYRGFYNIKGTYIWSDTLIRVPKAELVKYDPVPAKILDFTLVGVYYPDRRFTDTFRVLYYSKKRNSIIDQLHVYTLNRIDYLAVYMNKPYHPFYNLNKYFKIRDRKDSIYVATTQTMEF